METRILDVDLDRHTVKLLKRTAARDTCIRVWLSCHFCISLLSSYNLDFPVDCDDEYWETDDPATAFKQPLGKPSITSYAIAYCKLIEIIGMAQRTIYEENPKSGNDEWTKEVIANLDSALNDWIDQVPMHLRWDPHMVDPVFATQSAVLYACYYHVQIQIHRIFVNCPNMGLGVPVYASLAICTSSARACSHVMDVATRKGFLTNPYLLNAVFDSALLLLLNVWGGRHVGITVDPKKCMQDVEMCIRVFQVYEPRSV
ncbi:hypothetical protein FB45DRAFT_469159 [Roridomyces roridus]|uniref:Transcription factor domain-containing protein n=1 Tax=Roridomyces roridus TaxID=1738132 RepID=A0AAD7BYY7_9AGAR|nr:hypothetical protein FB45DRAFT_469159 [Roridomyces roridus]